MALLANEISLTETGQNARQQLIALMDRFEQPLCGYLRVMLVDSDAVFDCAQDTFLRAFEHLENGKTINGQWLYKVARNRAIDNIRHGGRLRREPTDVQTLVAADVGLSPQDARTRLALSQLTQQERELLHLALVDGYRSDEIGAMLGIRAGAVRTRLFRARERFRTVYRGMS